MAPNPNRKSVDADDAPVSGNDLSHAGESGRSMGAGPSTDWTAYRTFLTVYRSGSLSKAARELGVSQPTVGRRIETLQNGLGVALFTRSHVGLKPTEVADAVAEHALAMEVAAKAIPRDIAAAVTVAKRTIRITADTMLGSLAIPKILVEFHRDNPSISTDLIATDAIQDLLQRDVDIAVRAGRPAQNALVARRIGTCSLGLFASPALADRLGRPSSLSQLRGAPIVCRETWTHIEAIRDLLEPAMDPAAQSLRSDNWLCQLHAVKAGLGVGLIHTCIAEQDRDLVRLAADDVCIAHEIWLAMHEDLRHLPHVRKAFDALASGLHGWLKSASNTPSL